MAALRANMADFNDEPKTTERCMSFIGIHKVTTEGIDVLKFAREFA